MEAPPALGSDGLVRCERVHSRVTGRKKHWTGGCRQAEGDGDKTEYMMILESACSWLNIIKRKTPGQSRERKGFKEDVRSRTGGKGRNEGPRQLGGHLTFLYFHRIATESQVGNTNPSVQCSCRCRVEGCSIHDYSHSISVPFGPLRFKGLGAGGPCAVGKYRT